MSDAVTQKPRFSDRHSQHPAAWSEIRERGETLAARLPALQIEAERIANTVAHGIHGRRRVGSGETFWQFRRYQPGDQRAGIDWRKSAKSQHVYIRQHEWEAADSVWVWRDASPSMGYKSNFASITKLERASVLAIAVTSLLVRGGERVAQLDSATPPSTGRVTLRRLSHAFADQLTEGTELPRHRQLPGFAKVVLIGDFLHPLTDLTPWLTRLAAGGVKGCLLQITDPSEEDFPFEGRIQFQDLESSKRITFGRTETIRNDYRHALHAHREGLSDWAGKFGWSFCHHRTDHSPEQALLSLFAALSSHLEGE